MSTSRENVDAVPETWLQTIQQIMDGITNTSLDLHKPHLRPAFVHNYGFFIFIYSVLVVFGAAANIGVLYDIFRRALYHDATYCFIINLAISDFLKCVFVLPITLAVLLIQNWIFGQFLCFFLPMMQDIPLHVSTLTFLLIALDRYRFMKDPNSPRLSAFVCATGTWFFAVCIVLPYLLYITYLDIGGVSGGWTVVAVASLYKRKFSNQWRCALFKRIASILLTFQSNFEGLGVCVLNLADDMQEYMRTLFLIMYAAPLGTIAYLYVKSSRELQRQEEPLSVVMQGTNIRVRHSSSVATASPPPMSTHSEFHRNSSSSSRRRCDSYEAELDICREKRNQRHLVSMVTVFAICLCPLMVLRLARLAVTETYENAAHFDITYAVLVWLGFVPTCATPCVYASWQMSRNAKDRLRGYFRFSNRKLRACGQHHRHSGDVDSDAINRVCSCDTGDAGSVVSYVHKSSNASSCQVEQLYAGS